MAVGDALKSLLKTFFKRNRKVNIALGTMFSSPKYEMEQSKINAIPDDDEIDALVDAAVLEFMAEVTAQEKWIVANDTQIITTESSYNVPESGEIEVEVVVADGDGTPDGFSEVENVNATITPGTGDATWGSGGAGPWTFTRTTNPDGSKTYKATITIAKVSTGTATLQLVDSASSGLIMGSAPLVIA